MEDDETLEPKAKLKPFEARRLGGGVRKPFPKLVEMISTSETRSGRSLARQNRSRLGAWTALGTRPGTTRGATGQLERVDQPQPGGWTSS